MMMMLLNRSIKMLCVALLMAAALLATSGPMIRFSQFDGQVVATSQPGSDLTSSHAKCRHVAEHSHDLLDLPGREGAERRCAGIAHSTSLDPFPHQATVNPLEHPPRA